MKRIILAMALVCVAFSAHAQHTLQVDNGPGRVGIFDVSGLTSNRTFTLPDATGTVLVVSGSNLTINGNSLVWPTNAVGYLYNDGSGNLSWGSPSGSGTVTNFSFTDGGGFTGNVTNATTTPTLSLTLQNAAADGSTKGQASFTSNDFDATAGNISIDYTNGQTASGSTKGFLTAADWTTFNGKQDALTTGNLTGTAPVSVTGGTGAVIGSGASISVATMVGSGGSAAAGLVPTPPGTSGTTKFLREDGSWEVPASGSGSHGTYFFSSSDTWVVPTGVTKILVELAGGGGGGGGDDGSSNTGGGGGEGGGGGAYARAIVNVTAGETLTITVGSGGTAGTGGAATGTDGTDGDDGGNSEIDGSTSGADLIVAGGGAGGDGDNNGGDEGSGEGTGGTVSSASTTFVITSTAGAGGADGDNDGDFSDNAGGNYGGGTGGQAPDDNSAPGTAGSNGRAGQGGFVIITW